jgi:hypothetical protein
MMKRLRSKTGSKPQVLGRGVEILREELTEEAGGFWFGGGRGG